MFEVEDLAHQFTDDKNETVQLCRERGIPEPMFHLVLTPNGLIVFEEAANVGAPLREWPGLAAFAPLWAISQLSVSAKPPGSGHGGHLVRL